MGSRYSIINKVKSYMMPIAMISGGLLHQYMDNLSFLTPFLIALMLFITYCNISLQEIKFSRLHLWLIIIQLAGSVLIYLILAPFHRIIAQGAMICILAPTATSAPVITGMLGGNVASLTAYSLISNMTLVIMGPLIFTFAGEVNASSFMASLWIVFEKVFMLLFLPLFGAILLKRLLPRVHYQIRKARGFSFYLWTLALCIITGKIVVFIRAQESPDYMVEITLFVIAFIICITQFIVGRSIGKRYVNTIAGGQGLGQKNTVLAIWMAQTYLNPIASIAPGAYVLWQNIVNSYQVWRNRKNLE